MRPLIWTVDARNEFADILRFIADDSPKNAVLVKDRIERCAEHMVRAHSGRTGRVKGTFEVIVHRTKYILAYALVTSAEGVEESWVLHIIHGARKCKRGVWPSD